MSGRGLGFTGGTVDKMESIPGFRTAMEERDFINLVNTCGIAVIGQTGQIAPADKKIYAIRDICGTVESIDLITASILSKKLAAGLQYLVMDLKCGNGAFMTSLEEARNLAKSIVRVANLAGTKTTALLTDMNQVLGHNVGNALEMKEAVDFLKNENQDHRLYDITLALCAELLVNTKLARDEIEAKQKLKQCLQSGKALEVFAKMVSSLGGPKDFCEQTEKYLAHTAICRPVYTSQEGYVASMQTRNIGLALIELKGGRTRSDQKLDYATGFSDFCHIGNKVDSQTPLCFIHAQTEEDFKRAEKNILNAVTITEKQPSPTTEIIEKIGY
jgi:thymidine phosphorylase